MAWSNPGWNGPKSADLPGWNKLGFPATRRATASGSFQPWLATALFPATVPHARAASRPSTVRVSGPQYPGGKPCPIGMGREAVHSLSTMRFRLSPGGDCRGATGLRGRSRKRRSPRFGLFLRFLPIPRRSVIGHSSSSATWASARSARCRALSDA